MRHNSENGNNILYLLLIRPLQTVNFMLNDLEFLAWPALRQVSRRERRIHFGTFQPTRRGACDARSLLLQFRQDFGRTSPMEHH